MQNSKAALEQAGVISGKESGTQIAGLVKSAATVGVSATISAVKGVAGAALGGAAGAAGGAVAGALGAASKALSAIGSGNLAGKFADQVTSGLGSLKNAIDGVAGAKGLADVVGQAKGLAAGAFNTIKNAFPKMKAGVPVNVATVAKEAAAKAEEAASTVPGPASNLLNAVKDTGSGLISGAKGLASNLQNQMSGGDAALGKVTSAAQGGAMADFQAAAGKVLGKSTGGTSLLGAVSQIAGTAASIAPNAKGGALLGAISAAAGSSGGLQSTITNTISGAVQGAVSGEVNKLLDKATGGVSSKILATTSVINSITGTKATGIAGAFGSVATAISNPGAAIKGALTSKLAGGVSALASGMSNLPGGAGAAASLVNKAGSVKGKLGTLGGALDKLGGEITNKFASELNKVAPPLLGAAASLAKSGFPAGAAAQLESAISSIGSGGGSPLKMPAIAFNTCNNEAVNAQTNNLLGDPDIPPPPGGEVSASTVSSYEDAQKNRNELEKKYFDTVDEVTKLGKKRKQILEKLDKAKESLPQGDPGIQSLQNEYDAAYTEWSNKIKEAQDLQLRLG
jgi:hypothetical protein